MKKIPIKQNQIIIILCITIICMAIGFAYLSMRLEKSNNKEEIFDVSFTKVTAGVSVKGDKKEPTGTTSITNRNKTLTMEFNLNAPRDELSYTATIKNEGTLPAEIINVITVPDYLNDYEEQKQIFPVTISQNDIIGKILQPEEEIQLKITVLYKLGGTTTAKKIPYQVTILSQTPQK